MKISLNRLAVAICFGFAATPLAAQYPASTYQSPVYAPPQARMPTYAAPTTQAYGRPAPQMVASRPAAGYGVPAAAATGPLAFRPVNPPSAATQRVLVASNTPTPAPAPVRAVSQPMMNPAASGPAPTMWTPGANALGWESSQGSMGNYGGPAAGGYVGPQGAMPGGYAGGPGPMQGGYTGGPMPGGYSGGPGPGAAPAAPMDYSYGGSGGSGAPGGCGCGGGGGAVSGGGCNTCGGSGSCGGCGLRCCCLCGGGHTCCVPFRGPGDMVQHMPHFGTTHGYYYFRPYHVMHVFSQQELATRWGGDPRNPYDNTMFQRIYEQMGVAAPAVVPPTQTVPAPVVPTITPPPGQPYTSAPTPVPNYGTVPQYGPMQMMPGQGGPMMQQPGMEYVPSPIR